MPKETKRHARLKELFFQAIEMEERDRRRFLDEMCVADAELRAELESLRRYHQRSDLPKDFYDRRH
jgi:hypothetical protein